MALMVCALRAVLPPIYSYNFLELQRILSATYLLCYSCHITSILMFCLDHFDPVPFAASASHSSYAISHIALRRQVWLAATQPYRLEHSHDPRQVVTLGPTP